MMHGTGPGAFRRLWTRDIHGGHYAELFLIAGVSTILIVRAFLAATGYPQVGGKTQLHIAHMLWGGLLMVIALGLTFMLWSKLWKTFIAVIGGIGFGLFIDELGKFITKDNDYFYSPSIALIYIIFTLFFIASRVVSRPRSFSAFEIRMNALSALELMAIGRLSALDRDAALHILKGADANDQIAQHVQEALRDGWVTEKDHEGFYSRMRDHLLDGYRRIANHRLFRRVLVIFFTIDGLYSLASIPIILLDDRHQSGFVAFGTIASSLLVAICNGVGIYFLWDARRLDALRAFQAGVMVSILFVQVFSFATSQLAAISGLFLQLFLFGALHFVINQMSTEQVALAETVPAPKALPSSA